MKRFGWIVHLIKLLVLLFLFFVAIELIGSGFKLLGEDFAMRLMRATSNPLVGLIIGLLATSVVQSSSTTTSIIVAMVAGGAINISNAVPMVMGANIGTTITNTIVSLAHITRKPEFRKAFAGATMHDFFNLLAVVVFLPLQVLTGFLEKGALFLTKLFEGVGGMQLISPIHHTIKPVVKKIVALVKSLGLSHGLTVAVIEILALFLLFFALRYLIAVLKGALMGKIEVFFHNYIFKNTFQALFWGFFITAIIQSSSLTTSLIVPLIAGGIVTLEEAFPYTVGANVGTTFTAIMASFATKNPAALSVAFTHLLFNICGGAVFIPLKQLPLSLARWLADIAAERRWVAILYVMIIFYIIPLTLLLLFGGL